MHREVGKSVGASIEPAGFFASILSGLLLGLLADHLLGTEPVLVIIGILAGNAVGFWKMWHYANDADDDQR